MLSIDPNELTARDNYKLLIGTIIPRPIALVTTLGEDGTLNAAPFSFFNIVSSDPPMVSVAVQRKQGIQKDTSRNAIALGAFVVHIVDEDNVEAVNRTAASLPPQVSEMTLGGLTEAASIRITVPGIAEAKARMECVLEQSIPLGGTENAPACDLLIGRVVAFHLDETIYHDGYISAEVLKPVSRLAGNDYARLGSTFTIERPL